MKTLIAIFLLIFIVYNYFTPFRPYKANLPKPLSCGSCMSFWVILLVGLFIQPVTIAVIAACSSFLLYQLFFKYL